MTSLPEEALQKLICTACKKYLSVFPIKVYPNKNVKCGRCCDSKEDDGGTVSRLYEQIAKQVEFPCINRFEGCKEVLSPNEMEKHEETCYSDDYQCPLCDDFNGSSYDLLYHMRIKHKKAVIESKDFLVELDNGSKSETHFYCRNSFFVVVKYQYDASIQELILFLDLIGKHRTNRKNVMFTFSLYSVKNKLQYKSGVIQSSKCGLKCEEGLNVNVATHRYPRNILMCKFQLCDSTLLLKKCQIDMQVQCELPPISNKSVQCELPPILDKSKNEAILIFTFNGISRFKVDDEHYSVCKYWVGDKCWWLSATKRKRRSSELMMILLSTEKSIKPRNVVIVTMTLKSFVAVTLSTNLLPVRIEDTEIWCFFLPWNQLMDCTKGYVKDDSIEIHVLIKVLPSEEDLQCPSCKGTGRGGPSFDLLSHMKINHKKAAIENKEFLIELQDGLRSDVYFHCQNSFFVFVKYQYDSSTQELMLFLDVIGKHRTGRKNVEYTFMLYSIHNKLQYKSGIMKGLATGLDYEKSLKVDIAQQRYPKNILICKLKLWDPVVMMNKYRFVEKIPPQNQVVDQSLTPILDKSINKALLIFKFDGVTTFEIENEIKSDCKYWVGDRCWWLEICRNYIDTKEYMSLYLCQDELNKCKIVATVTLRSFVSHNLNLSLPFVCKSFETNRGWSKFIDWDVLTDAERGYLNNDCIEIHVLLEVLPHEITKCAECQKPCPTCAP